MIILLLRRLKYLQHCLIVTQYTTQEQLIKRCFTLGSAYGTPSTATSYITDSTGAQLSNPKANTTNINKQGSGYSWANGYQMNGFQAKQG